jgi:hypothetical protein
MIKTARAPSWTAEAMLLLVAAVWGASYGLARRGNDRRRIAMGDDAAIMAPVWGRQ